MEEQDNDNIYIYNEEEETEPTPASPHRGPSPFRLMLEVMLNPVSGWKSVRRSGLTSEKAQRDCFYPLMAVLAMSKFAVMAYSSRVQLPEVVTDALVSFVSFFFGYFCIMIAFKTIMPRLGVENFNTEFGKVFVIISLSTLCLFFTITNLLPMLWAILIFLPLWTVYIICRGARFFRFPEQRQILGPALLSLVIVGMPLFLGWLLDGLIPG